MRVDNFHVGNVKKYSINKVRWPGIDMNIVVSTVIFVSKI